MEYVKPEQIKKFDEIVETEDETDLAGELACAGDNCEIKWND